MTVAAMRARQAKRIDDTAPTKLRMYQGLWQLIAANTSDKPVKVTCPVGNQGRLIRAVIKEKNLAKSLRDSVDAVGYGKLIVKRDGNQVFFSLLWNGDMV